MAIECHSSVRNERVEVSRLYPEDGFLLLKGDPKIWIQSNPADRLSSVRCLELDLWKYKGEAIGDSIGQFSELIHLCSRAGFLLKSLPNSVSRLRSLQHLKLHIFRMEELPANLGDLESLASLFIRHCCNLKPLPDSVAKLSKLTSLSFHECDELEELPANLGDLQSLKYLSLFGCDYLKSLPGSITKLSKLRFLYLPFHFRLYTLPSPLDDSLVISVEETHIRKTWKELKSDTELFLIPIPLVDVAHFPFTPGYLRLKGDPKPWIQRNYGLHPFVRLLDLELEDYENQGNVPESLGELPELTHLYIYNGCLSLIFPFRRIIHLSLSFCDFECDTEYRFDSLGKLSELVSLHLTSDVEELPAHMYLPVSLRYLSLSSESLRPERLPDSYMSSIGNLSKLKTLVLSRFRDLELLPLKLHLTKLILRDSTTKSLPMGLQHLEIIHFKHECRTQRCNNLNVCLNQLVNLETLSYTCYRTKFLPRLKSLHNLRELQLKDCFSLKGLPSKLDELVRLGFLNLSGTRIKSLPNNIMKLRNLRHLILPKCFMLESLPCNFENEVMISVDDTCEKYYMDEGYYKSCYDKNNYDSCSDEGNYDSCSDEGYEITPGTMEEVNEVVVKESTTKNIIEKQVQNGPLSHLPDAIQISEGSYFPSRTDPISNDSHHASSYSQNLEMDIFPTGNTMQVDAPIELEVSRSTMKHKLKEYGITCPSSRKRKLQDPSNPAGCGHGMELLDATNWLPLSDHVPSKSIGVNDSTLDALTRTVEEPPMSTQCRMDGHQHIQYSNGVKECALWNSVQPNRSSSTFVVKAAYKEDIVRFDFSLSSSIEQLKEEVGKRLELEVGKFKMNYQDDEKERILITCISDLEHALRLSKSTGSNVVRLSIELKKIMSWIKG